MVGCGKKNGDLRINMEYPNGSVWIDTCKDHIKEYERIKEYYHEWYRKLVFVECLKCDDCKVYYRRNDKWELHIKEEIYENERNETIA